MSTLDIKKSAIIELLSGSVDESTLTKILNLLSQPSSSRSEELPSEVVDGIKRGKSQISAGKFVSNDEMKAHYQKRFPNAKI